MSRRRSAALRLQSTWGDEDHDPFEQAFPEECPAAPRAGAVDQAETVDGDDDAPLELSGLSGFQNADRQSHLTVDPSLLDTVSDLVWRGAEFGRQATECLPTSFPELDAELPGGGWPLSNVSEVLQPQFCQAEWRLLLPGIAARASAKRPLLAIAPPHAPFFGGLRQHGLDEGGLVVIHAKSPAERLWATEQAVKANGLAGVIAWLANARGDQVRRLQTCAAQCGFPIFLVRPESAQHESSAAPLRLQVRLQGLDAVGVHVLKRRGPAHVGWMTLSAPPPGLAGLLPTARSPALPSVLAGMRPAVDVSVPAPITKPAHPPAPVHIAASFPSSPVLSHVFADATVDGASFARPSGR